MKWNLALGNAFGNSHDWKSVIISTLPLMSFDSETPPADLLSQKDH